MFILNSFIAVSSVSFLTPFGEFSLSMASLLIIDHQLNYDIFDAISKAEGQISTDMGGFAATFAPIEDESEGLKLALDLIGLGFAMFASPMWNSGM